MKFRDIFLSLQSKCWSENSIFKEDSLGLHFARLFRLNFTKFLLCEMAKYEWGWKESFFWFYHNLGNLKQKNPAF